MNHVRKRIIASRNIFSILKNNTWFNLGPYNCHALEPTSIHSHAQSSWSPPSNPEDKIRWKKDELVYIYDLSLLKKLYKHWENVLPNVHPFYAIKCNPNPEIIKTLANCGAYFDCASPAEIKTIVDAGIPASKILYANPCKRETDIIFMRDQGVIYTTFDSICELNKIATLAPDTKCVLRIYANDPTAQCILSNKYGAFEEEWEGLLAHANVLGLDVVGISFHVGSGACNPHVFYEALKNARHVVDMGKQFGFTMEIIDIGGGFSVKNITMMACSIQKALDEFFPEKDKFRIIAEPGRYFAETIGTLYTKIVGVRERRGVRDYFITDSVYGSFNCLLYDHCTLKPESVRYENTTIPSSILGPTCDGGDIVMEKCQLPRMELGDWIRWRNMGAYTIAASCDFNGINFTSPRYIYI